MGQYDDLRELRKRAERQLRREPRIPGLPDDRRMLIHELRVHQLELEMQNDALSESQAALSVSQARYRALYELAPVACLSVGDDTSIAEANLAAAALLGAGDAKALLGMRFARYLTPEHSERLEHHRRELYELRKPCSCELRLRIREQPRRVLLQSGWIDGPIGARWLMALVELPQRDRERMEQPVNRTGSQPARALGVALVVESDGLVRAAILRQLRLIGCEVREAETARAALALLRDGASPQLLVSDIALPDLPAERFVTAARELQPDMRVLLLSPYASSHPATAAARAIDPTILSKPFASEELRVAVYRRLSISPDDAQASYSDEN